MRILIPNRVTPNRSVEVKRKMESLGAPVIYCIEISPDYYFALEGSHRVTAAHELGLIPTVIVVDTLDGADPVLDEVRKTIPVRESRGLLLDFAHIG